jgi:hypothetical protein
VLATQKHGKTSDGPFDAAKYAAGIDLKHRRPGRPDRAGAEDFNPAKAVRMCITDFHIGIDDDY